ncbi:hypothetical protein [Longimicrobium sp.]|uniref:hypothetical protein n=1 Tax=Longimicrobium sp. TaxID=2029185 RepID=UPI002CC62C12|nr:hypothetical protein [Longimicrobium sp.]HSU13734.1 hypothetical protein [Longimicrobium sp.]
MTDTLQLPAWYYCRARPGFGVRTFRRDLPFSPDDFTCSLIDLWYTAEVVSDSPAKLLLDLPYEVLDVDLLVLRGPVPTHVELEGGILSEYLNQRTSRKIGLAVLEFARSEGRPLPPRLDILVEPEKDVPADVLRTLREVELRAQLDWTGAIVSPPNAHFELPAGTHANTFIRVADCLNETAAIARIADWLTHELTENTVIIGDTWTIMPLLQELAFRGEALNGKRPHILAFQSYPFVSHVEQLLARVPPTISSETDATVLFIMSVVSTGSLAKGFQEFAPRILGRRARVLPVALVDTREESEPTSLVHFPNVVRFNVPRGELCEFCRDTAKRPIVRIHPRTYSPVIEGTIQPQMLRPEYALAHRRFWEVASEQEAIQVHKDDDSTGERRHLPVAIDVARLLKDRDFRRSMISKLRTHSPLCDLIVVPEHPSTPALLDLAEIAYHKPSVVKLPRPRISAESNDDYLVYANRAHTELEEKLAGVEHILILDDVVIHGRSIRAIHRLLQDTITKMKAARPLDEYQIHAFVIVGRPPTATRWDRLLASLRQTDEGVHLGAGEVVYLSDDPHRCPWCEELSILRRVVSELSDDSARKRLMRLVPLDAFQLESVLSLVQTRIGILQPLQHEAESGLSSSLFLCGSDGSITSREAECLSPHSLFGERLKEPAAYAAVATALQEIRVTRAKEFGANYAWQVPKILTAYHDPLLSASFLRATFSEEIALSESGREFDDALAEISFSSTHSDFRQSPVLVAELQWALVTEKLPPAFSERVQERIQPVIDQIGDPLRSMLAVVREIYAPGFHTKEA